MQHPTPEQLDQMASLARQRSPRETGGVLLRGELIEITNRAPEDCTDLYNYTVDDLEAVIGDASVDEVLFWHTHPNGWIGPSRYDMESRLEGFQYLVVTITENAAIPVRY